MVRDDGEVGYKHMDSVPKLIHYGIYHHRYFTATSRILLLQQSELLMSGSLKKRKY